MWRGVTGAGGGVQLALGLKGEVANLLGRVPYGCGLGAGRDGKKEK